jgi:hypothetical protein
VEGHVTDASLKPIADVCVAIGPNGCRRLSPRTDGEGNWSFDFPQVEVAYDLHFKKDGYRQIDVRIDLTGPRRVDTVMVANR